ncbi:MAG: hypothetical protein QG656_1835, partial [Candidatus Hydrogenedentes bacterium]|nr:hypothetical protein [Candidatus Hydrogenedentota bacterium]
MDRMTLIALVALAALMAWPRSGMAAPIEYWTTHALDKLFPDSAKPADAPTAIALKLARNETEDAQVAVRTPIGVEVSQAAFTFTDLAGPGGAVLTKDHLNAWWVWYTYVLNNPKANLDPATCLRKAPGFFPDAFLESKTARIRDEWTQPLWVSVTAPKGTPPGEYTGTLGIDLQTDKGPEHIDVPLTVTVWPFTLPDEPHLHHTEWFSHGGLADYYRVELWSEAHWTWIGRVAADMAKHKQDTILTPFSALVDVTGTSPDTLTFTFTRLDRWVETFKNAGVTWIEGGHVGGREGGWESQIVWARFPILGVDTSAAAMTEEAFEPYMEA